MNAPQSQAQSKLAEYASLDDREGMWRSLALQLAKNIMPVDQVVSAHGLTPEQFDTVRQNPTFNAMLLEAMQNWDAADNAPERIKLKYLGMVEASAPDFFKAMINPNVPIRERTELLKTIMKGAAIGNEGQTAAMLAAGGGNRVSIVIKIGDDRINIAQNVPTLGNDPNIIDIPASASTPPMGQGVSTSINRNEEIKEIARQFVAENLPTTEEVMDYDTILSDDEE